MQNCEVSLDEEKLELVQNYLPQKENNSENFYQTYFEHILTLAQREKPQNWRDTLLLFRWLLVCSRPNVTS